MEEYLQSSDLLWSHCSGSGSLGIPLNSAEVEGWLGGSVEEEEAGVSPCAMVVCLALLTMMMCGGSLGAPASVARA